MSDLLHAQAGREQLWLGTQRQMLAGHSRAVHVSVLTGKSSLAYGRFVGDVFKALADPTRRVILDELQERSGQTLFELCVRLTTKHRLGSSRQAISQHLAVLESAGLIVTHRQGRYKYHDLDTTPLRTIVERWQTGH